LAIQGLVAVNVQYPERKLLVFDMQEKFLIEQLILRKLK